MRIYFLIATLLVMVACNKQETITPDPAKPKYTLPQGNHSYDDTIVAFYKQYGSYILYKFTQLDFDYNYIDRKTDTAYVANTAYVSPAFIFLKTQLFNQYPEPFLQKTMPFKILLASKILDKFGVVKDCSVTGSMLAFGYTDSTLSKKTPAELRLLRGNLHRSYMERAYRVSTLAVPDEFATTAPANYTIIDTVNRYSFGVVETIVQTWSQLNIATDYLGYIEMITGHSYDELNAPGNPLSPEVDVNGLVRKRYNIVVNYFTNMYGIDLQAIGNLP